MLTPDLQVVPPRVDDRRLLQRPASLREMRFWREVGVLRADW